MPQLVILSSDRNVDYSFFVPLSSLLWQRCRFQPVVFLVGTVEGWLNDAPSRVSLATAQEVGAHCVFIGDVHGQRTSTVAQTVRLYPGLLDYALNTYCLTADIDIWPLAPDWFNVRNTTEPVHLFYANAYDHVRYPMCYIGMPSGVWREVMGHGGEELPMVLQQQLDAGLGWNPCATAAWNYDERLFGDRIRSWTGYPHRCRMIDRMGAPPCDRIDRSAWPVRPDPRGMIDAHLPRPGFGSWWPSLRHLFNQVLPERGAWADAYREAFREAIQARSVD